MKIANVDFFRFKYYSKIRDVQTLALLCCVLSKQQLPSNLPISPIKLRRGYTIGTSFLPDSSHVSPMFSRNFIFYLNEFQLVILSSLLGILSLLFTSLLNLIMRSFEAFFFTTLRKIGGFAVKLAPLKSSVFQKSAFLVRNRMPPKSTFFRIQKR